MPEHVHLLLSEPKQMLLSKIIGALKTEVSRKAPGPPPLWQRRYYDFNVITHGKLVEKLRSMHRNPVKRGLVEKPEDWPWSSFRHWLSGETGRIEIESHWTWDQRTDFRTLTMKFRCTGKPTHDQVLVMGGAPGTWLLFLACGAFCECQIGT